MVIAGIAQEIVDRLQELHASPGHVIDTMGFVKTITPYHPEIYKSLVIDMLKEAGVELLLHSMIAEATVTNQRISSI